MGCSTEVRENRAFVVEIKFLVPADRAHDLRTWARALLRPDPFGGGPFGDTYQTNTLYFDTPAFDVFHRYGSYGRSKYRARRYGLSTDLFLERKLKTRNRVSKRRSIVDIGELPRIGHAEPLRGSAGHWFQRRILIRELAPVCQVAYTRTALVHANGDGPIRMTLDVDLRAASTRDLAFRDLAGRPSLIGRDAILELKYSCFRPPVFDELIERFALVVQPISKYRTAIGSLYATEVAVA